MYPWFNPLLTQLNGAFLQGKGHHALLLLSEQGLGSESLLTYLAQGLLCTQQAGIHACGQCSSCQLFKAGNHPDYHVLNSIDNKAISIDQVREVSHALQQYAHQDGNKVVVIQPLDKLSESAANALLKTLEEPSENTYFVMLADMSANITATIYSRSQVWKLTAPQSVVSQSWIEQQYPNYTKEEINTALCINYQRPLSALNMLQEGLLAQRKDFLRQLWLFYQHKRLYHFFSYFALNNTALLADQINWLMSFFQDALKQRLHIHTGWVNQDIAKGISLFAEQHSSEQLLKASELTTQLRQDLMINGVNQELMVLDYLTKLIMEVFEV